LDPFAFVTAHSAPETRSGPFRQIARLAHELHFNGLRNLNQISPRRYDRGAVLMLIARCCLLDWTRGETLGPPVEPTIFASINSLAASLGRPYETVRSHAHALVEEGMSISDPKGVALSAAPDAARRIVDYLAATHDVFLRFSEDISRWIDLPVRAGVRRPGSAVVLKPALDVQLAPFEMLRTAFADRTAQMVWAFVAGGCVRHITVDPVLSARYAEDLPPDEERRPVTLAALEAIAGLPYSTIWRHVRRLEAENLLIRKDKGWIAGAEILQAPGVEQVTRAAATYYCRRVAELAYAGFDVRSAEGAYLRERPALASLAAI
jgi:hypothetical protein